MKYLKKYKIFEALNESNIHDVCREYGITNYTINDDGSIDGDGDVYLSNSNLTKLPLNFNHISGDFNCQVNKLTSLEGAPKEVDGDFYCDENQLISLKGAPLSVGGVFNCRHNKLTSLEGAPKEVGGYFDCSYVRLTSLEGSPVHVGDDFYCQGNKLTSLEGAPKHIGGVFNCRYNQLMYLDHLPEVRSDIYMDNNPVNSIVYMWIEEPEGRWERWEYFQDSNIIQGDKVILPRLEEFHEVIEIPMPNLNKIKKYYKIIE